jgi:hypothetical protein
MPSIGTRPAPCTDYRIINMLLKVKDDEFIDDIERALHRAIPIKVVEQGLQLRRSKHQPTTSSTPERC